MHETIIIKTNRLVFKNFTYMVKNSAHKTALIIDPAWELKKYDDVISNHEVELRGILLTHHHLDHSHLASDLASKYNCPVYLAAEEIDYYNFTCSNLCPISANSEFIEVGNIVVRVIRTPGHTSGGVCYLIDNKLYTGDTLFIEGCGICKGKGASPTQMYGTMQLLKSMIPKSVLIYPGHQFKYPLGQTFEFVLEHNIYLQFTDLDTFTKFRMRKNQGSILNFI